MSPKKKPGKPKISYRDLMSKQSDKATPAAVPEADVPPSVPEAKAVPKQKEGEPRGTRGTRGTAKEKKQVEVAEAQPSKSARATSDEGSGQSSASSSLTTAEAIPAPPASSASNAVSIPVEHAQQARHLPPARRRDRSRELTPRELAAVLNEEQMKAAAEKAAADAREAALEPAAPLTLGQLPPVAEPRSSGEGAMSDTMEFAVAAAVATLPFRDRVRARAGVVEVLLFRIGEELFATDLTASEEAIEAPTVHRVPEMPEQMLGFFSLRGKLLPVFSPSQLLGASLSKENGAAVVLRAGEKRIALAIDDVDDVMPLDLARLRDVPAASDPEGVLLGVAWRENELVSLIDAEALLAACQSEQLVETA